MKRAPPTLTLPEDAAWRVLAMQALEADASATSPWTVQDREWASRLARETTPAGAGAEVFLGERARHVLQRLRGRGVPTPADTPPLRWRWRWLGWAAVLGLLLGGLADVLGGRPWLDLLAPQVWAVLAWNLVVCAAALLPLDHGRAGGRGLTASLARSLARYTPKPARDAEGARGRPPALPAVLQAWARHSAPLWQARAALLLHAVALGVVLGLVVGLYARGLVWDYRVGWQSTFLTGAQLHAALSVLLTPASLLTGVAVPDAAALQALQLAPGALPLASAAPWIHLYAALLMLGAAGPRLLLAAAAAGRARRLSRRLPLPLDDIGLHRLLHERTGAAARVQLLPHAAEPDAAALAGLRQVLAAALGDSVRLDVRPAPTPGDEDRAGEGLPTDADWRLLAVELGSTPEDDVHGRWLQAVQRAAPALPVLLMVDEGRTAARFATLPERLAQRRDAWAQWAAAHGVALWSVDLLRPEPARAAAALLAARPSAPGATPESR